MTTCVVYEATCREHGKRYVGQSKDFPARVRSHKYAAAVGSKSLFHRAIRKHGIEMFDFHVRAELPTVAEAKIAEMRGRAHSDETRAKISATKKNQAAAGMVKSRGPQSAETRAKISATKRAQAAARKAAAAGESK